MRKGAIHTMLVLLFSLILCSTYVPPVLSEPENIEILSYNWYLDSLGYLVVVGEVQNTGSKTIDSVVVTGTVYTPDGTPQAESFSYAYAKNLIPKQKAPFYMEFYTEDMSWIDLGVDRVDFVVNQANTTNNYQYPDLALRDASSYISAVGEYWVKGTVKNIGSQTSRNIRVIGTFYNSSGTVVAMGYTDVLSPASLGPSGTASFQVGAFDMNQTIVPSSFKILSYSLLIQAEEPILSGTAPSLPPSEPTNSSSPSDSSDPSDAEPLVSFSAQFLYVVVGIVVFVGLAATALALRKRKPNSSKKRESKISRKKKM